MSTTLDTPPRRGHRIGALAVIGAVIAGLFIAGSPAQAAVAKPGATNTGVPSGTALTKYTGPLTITVDGTVIDRKAVYGDLKIRAKNVIIRNSYLHCGTQTLYSSTACVDAYSGSVFNLQITHNTIRPDKPSPYRDGIVGHEFTARYNHISRSNDGIGIFNLPGGSGYANVTAEYNYIHDLTHWNNDPLHSDGTHNDGIQVQGGKNIGIRYNTVVGSLVTADGAFKYGTHGNAALMVTPNVSPVGNMVVDGNWFDNGQTSVGITNSKFSTVTFTLQNNKFGRNQYDYGSGSKYTIRIYNKAASTIYGLWTNRWEDNNVLLTDGRTAGVRYG